MKFENLDVFRTFIEDTLKMPFGTFDFDACVADFEKQIRETDSYELSPFETISGHPETISFERIDKFIRDGQEVMLCDDFDEVETTIIF